MKYSLILFLALGSVLPLMGQWNDPERNQRLLYQAPGAKLVRMNADTLLKDACADAMKKWKGKLNDAAFARLKDAEPRDSFVEKRFPRSISPYARIRGVNPSQKVYVATEFKGNDWKSVRGLFSYCPFCAAENYSAKFDKKNLNKAVTNCCKTVLYRDQYPADYKLKPNSTASFRYLDDSIRKIPCTLYKDKFGNEWELFIHHIFDNAYWVKIANDLVRSMNQFKKDGNPLHPYKAALILDHAADTYYGLPLTFSNLIAKGADGKEMSRAEWEKVQRPIVFKHGPLGPWNRRRPFSAGDKGWINMHKESIWCEPFALMRHHPAFKYYSRKKYGSEDALEKKIVRKLMREIILTYKACFSQRLMSNYQEANYKDLLMAGILAQDRFITDFAGANQELTLFNHHYHDGMTGEGAQNYMGMLESYYYPYMRNPKGYGLLDKDFLKDNPFFGYANTRWKQLVTIRGIGLEFGDQHQYASRNFPFSGKYEHLKAAQEKKPSENYPGYGVGLLRLGEKNQRLEVSLHYSRATLHNASDMLGISLWFDGIPLIRTGGYSSYWRIATKGEVDQFNQLNFPNKVLNAPRSGAAFPWQISHSPIEQNTVTVNDISSGRGWGDNRGTSEVVTWKGGEKLSDPEKTFQVLEVRSMGEFEKVGGPALKEFRRALLGVETPDRKAYVVDLLTIHGGKNHTQFYSAWGNRVSGPVRKGKEYPTLTSAWFNGVRPVSRHPDKFVLWAQNCYYSCFNHVKNVSLLDTSATPVWTIQWDTDYYAYFRNGNGECNAPRPKGSSKGKVSVRMTSVKVDSENASLWQGKAPWNPAAHRQPYRNGGFSSYLTVPFENGMDISMYRRNASGGKELESRFVQVFEGLHHKAPSMIRSVRKVLSNRNQTVLEIALKSGHTDLIIYQMKNGRVTLRNGITTDGRYALVRKDPKGRIVKAHLVRGTYLKDKKQSLLQNRYAELTGTIIDITGDITGKRKLSEMEIKPDQAWDPAALPGKDLQILTTRQDGHKPIRESYRIQSAKRLPNGHVLVKFANYAPFIAGWHQVLEINSKSPNVLRTNRPMSKFANQPWYEGAKVLFPGRNKTYVIKDTESQGGGFGGTILTLRKGVDLRKDGIKIGDWYIIYSIEPGQKVSAAMSSMKDFASAKK